MTALSPALVAQQWAEYGRGYAKYPSLWDGSLAFASGPLRNEGSVLRDYSGRTTGATWRVGAGDAPKYTTGSVKGRSFWASQFDGTNDFLSLAIAPTPPFSVSLWFNVPDVAIMYGLFSANNGVVTNGDYHRITASGSVAGDPVRAQSREYAKVIGTAASTVGYSENTWHHVVGTWQSSAYRSVLLDGTNLGTDTASHTPVVTQTEIGRTIGNGVGTELYLLGFLAGISVYSRTLTSSEISILAQHPLAAYEVNLPRYWMFSQVSGAKYWIWARQQSQIIGGGLT